jgi:hypothetical protein
MITSVLEFVLMGKVQDSAVRHPPDILLSLVFLTIALISVPLGFF